MRASIDNTGNWKLAITHGMVSSAVRGSGSSLPWPAPSCPSCALSLCVSASSKEEGANTGPALCPSRPCAGL